MGAQMHELLCAALSEQFGRPEHADCLIEFVHEAAEGRRCEEALAAPLPAHTLLIRCGSAWFHAKVRCAALWRDM